MRAKEIALPDRETKTIVSLVVAEATEGGLIACSLDARKSRRGVPRGEDVAGRENAACSHFLEQDPRPRRRSFGSFSFAEERK